MMVVIMVIAAMIAATIPMIRMPPVATTTSAFPEYAPGCCKQSDGAKQNKDDSHATNIASSSVSLPWGQTLP